MCPLGMYIMSERVCLMHKIRKVHSYGWSLETKLQFWEWIARWGKEMELAGNNEVAARFKELLHTVRRDVK